MRMSPGHIRSINRAIVKVQTIAWSASRNNPRQSTDVPAMPASIISAGTVKVIAVSRPAAS